MKKTAGSGSLLENSIGFSRACRIGDIIAISGTAAINEAGDTVCKKDVYGQTKRCIAISIASIEELGGSIKDVIRTRIMLKNISDWELAAKAHGEIFSAVKPACTFVEVSGFINPDWLVETEMDSVLNAQ